jgi:hypothetical protein
MNTKGLYTQQNGLLMLKTSKSSLEGDKSMEHTGLPKCCPVPTKASVAWLITRRYR